MINYFEYFRSLEEYREWLRSAPLWEKQAAEDGKEMISVLEEVPLGLPQQEDKGDTISHYNKILKWIILPGLPRTRAYYYVKDKKTHDKT